MDNSIDSAIDKLQSMLSSEEGKKDLENMINSFGGMQSPSAESEIPAVGGLDMGSIAKMKGIMDLLQRRDDPRSQLLLSLKPYLNPARSARLDTAVMLLSLGKIPEMIKNIRK